MFTSSIFRPSVATALLGLFIAVAGCSKKSDDTPSPSSEIVGQVTATLNGDGFTNYAYSQTATRSDAPDGEGVFAKAGPYTQLSVNVANSGAEMQNYWSTTVQGPATAQTVSWENSPNIVHTHSDIFMYVARNGGVDTYVCYLTSGTPAGGQTTITTYGANKGRIEGTFSGTVYNSKTHAPLTITNGKFWVTRTTQDL